MSTDVIGRAFEAYYRRCRHSGEIYQQPTHGGDVRKHAGQRYIILSNSNGVLAVFQWTPSDRIRWLDDWHPAITREQENA